MNIQSINELDDQSARDALLKCCGSQNWAQAMVQLRPYANADEVALRAAQAFEKMTDQDWLQAFAAHPRIGDVESLRAKYANTKDWASSEQSGVNGTNEQVLHDLAQGNSDYEKRYGHTFIVCATGKSAEEMLAILRQRLDNDAATELRNAAEEQKKITLLRLGKL